MSASPPRYRTTIGAVSLVLGPALMSVGDLFHPAENWDPAAQVAIVAESASRWYAAHFLLFVGLLVLIPGLLTLTDLVMSRRPAIGYASRLFLLTSVGALSAQIVFEMVLGRFLSEGANRAAAVTLLATYWSRVLVVLMPGLFAFFIGTGLAVVPLASKAGPFRWPALVLGLGAVLILSEIILSEVLLSQIGNILILLAGIAFARLLLRGPAEAY